MKIIISNPEFQLTFNGSSTYFIIDKFGTCCQRFSTERKALNFYKRLCKESGINN
jgi:hypothetical protein